MAFIEEEAPQEYYDKLFDELEVDLEESGFHCRRCGEHLSYIVPDEPHDCIECAECGEHDMCNCEYIISNMKPMSNGMDQLVYFLDEMQMKALRGLPKKEKP